MVFSVCYGSLVIACLAKCLCSALQLLNFLSWALSSLQLTVPYVVWKLASLTMRIVGAACHGFTVFPYSYMGPALDNVAIYNVTCSQSNLPD